MTRRCPNCGQTEEFTWKWDEEGKVAAVKCGNPKCQNIGHVEARLLWCENYQVLTGRAIGENANWAICLDCGHYTDYNKQKQEDYEEPKAESR